MRTAKPPALSTHRLERAIPCADLRVEGPHDHLMALGVFDNRRRRVKAHRLGVEQRASKLRRIVAFEPGRRISDQGEARRMAFGKTVLAEAADLLENPLGELCARCPSPACA